MREKLFHRDFTLVVIGQIISLLGNAVLRFVLPLYLLDVTGSRRHIDDHVVDILPNNVSPELFYRAGDHRTSPDDRIIGILQKKVDGHGLDAGLTLDREDLGICANGMLCDAECLWNGWTGHIGIHNGCAMSLSLQVDGKHGRDHGLSDTALTADNADYLVDPAFFIGLFDHTLWGTAAAIC